MPEKSRGADVLVVGGGVIGLATAWRLAQRGAAVTVLDPAPGQGASYAAAGLLAPVTEVHYKEEGLLALSLAAAQAYPDLAAELRDVTGVDVGYRTCGTLAVAADADDRAVIDELAAFQETLGLEVSRLSGRQCRELEPLLAPGIRGGLLVTGDHQVDNRALLDALTAAVTKQSVDVVRQRVAALVDDDDGACVGAQLDDGSTAHASTTVLAAGCWSRSLADVPVRPVRGQILRLHARSPFVARNVRCLVRGWSVYVVPRTNGEVVVGATVEEQGFDATVTAGGVYELLRDAHTVLPGITELDFVEAMAGLRPGSPDNAPIVGPLRPGLVVATGHGRNGILLTPVTATALADLVIDGGLPDVMAPFTPDRFVSVTS